MLRLGYEPFRGLVNLKCEWLCFLTIFPDERIKARRGQVHVGHVQNRHHFARRMFTSRRCHQPRTRHNFKKISAQMNNVQDTRTMSVERLSYIAVGCSCMRSEHVVEGRGKNAVCVCSNQRQIAHRCYRKKLQMTALWTLQQKNFRQYTEALWSLRKGTFPWKAAMARGTSLLFSVGGPDGAGKLALRRI